MNCPETCLQSLPSLKGNWTLDGKSGINYSLVIPAQAGILLGLMTSLSQSYYSDIGTGTNFSSSCSDYFKEICPCSSVGLEQQPSKLWVARSIRARDVSFLVYCRKF